ncbi:dye-decolorizing heme-containing peroxidase [Didymosphaeria variabile]|uniref:Dye-decolorizing heme-containing peroxidase n=1 Tax=Didymosphaeria variabile TaxID=1932322 RepID=A0A9W9CB88_9PLEO|nr:dye-decolorizing heme-containing peroxidase [Didymosphaeria variabile]KAJ4352586.1 dye-decolorizing heme-containing peroxidase [Didymosphaeria variabile]
MVATKRVKHSGSYYGAPQRKIKMADTGFKLSNVQGDILVGLSKKTEVFFFFQITNADAFKSELKNVVPLITTADKATGEKEAIRAFKAEKHVRINGVDGSNGGTNELGEITADPPLLSVVGVNIAFSQKGLIAVSQVRPGKLWYV